MTTENHSPGAGQEPGSPAPDSLGYEEAREQLAAIVARLEAGGASLEESLALWERGEALAKQCEEWLEGARRRLASAKETANSDEDS
ncbi:exodeoxyribonuclease VII small subunit [Arthrobacter cupressi]|uniref:Exodeoxyribonuclease 7 small subunit n=1 Tax=Arthrobacter cupressi TaxID=1045773 RepID=A0A1G8PG06_9MICC|nr:exodeoxyribonuclease VII small subunit [Arthrobacter cupressi]NYD76828.1 exodeoxyribonuclease VII small subunit [Arthrobacter cupressi]SDI91362.1 Exodeoxyribonuclease VII small subunit [Arthrobacter cupressi]